MTGDPLAAARGILRGVVLGVAVWIIIIGVALNV